MSKALSLKLSEDLFAQVEEIVKKARIPRNTYISRALDFYNAYNMRKIRRVQLHKESRLVRNESMRILREFESMTDNLFQ